jgi:hypothetical protein
VIGVVNDGLRLLAAMMSGDVTDVKEIIISLILEYQRKLH